MRAVACAAVTVALAVAGCGSSSPAQPSLSTFRSGFQAEKTSFRRLGLDLQKTITGAKAKTDAQLATEIGALSGRASGQASRLSRLDPTARFKPSLQSLVSGFRAVAADLQLIQRAATKHDGAAAKAATETLLADAAKVKTADDAITKGLGLPATG
ncbi:MAG: hypothetical protein NVS3B18_05210 [Candidatus Dormibacteria bacterium]